MTNSPDEAVRPGLAPESLAEKRERLLAATVEMVAKRGYRETSVEHVVGAARVDSSAFYELYPDKEACFLAAFDRVVEEGAAAIADAASGADGWPEEMAAGLGRFLDLIVADPRRGRIALVEIQAAGSRAYDRYEEVVDRAAARLREGRAFSAEAATFSGALEEAILGGILWIVQQRLVKGELDETGTLLEEAIQIALAPYLGDDEVRRLAAATLRDRARRT